jgi:tRNA(Ile)-lysidine synthetase-like protein
MLFKKLKPIMDYILLQNFYSLVYEYNEVQVYFLDNIQSFWRSNSDYWFSHSPISSWKTYQKNYSNTKNDNISFILHYDQIYRHPNPKIKEYNKELAFRFATHIAFRIIHSDQYTILEDWEKVFVLLCIRHNKSLRMKELALKKTLQEVEKSSSSLWIRFLNATIWDVHMCKHKNGYSAEAIHSDTSSLLTFDSILQSPQIKQVYCSKEHYNQLFKQFEKCMNDSSSKYAVSISGGVDSMVASYIMDKVCRKYKKDLILLHICYNNREECKDELNLLRFYSQQLERPLYIRSITEIKRCRTSDIRTLYEDITRRIRFSFYEYFACPVILGHNHDDCYENIFSNLSKQIHFDNLFGMSFKKIEQGVTILRPMLEIAKKDIVLFADHNSIPHLYDSTPKWSRRGQMRDILIPSITSFDAGILSGLDEFIKYANFLEQQWQRSFDEWIAKVPKLKDTFRIPRDAFFGSNFENLNFWIRLWSGLSLSCRPSNKSFQNLIERLRAIQTHPRPEHVIVILNASTRTRILKDALEITLHSGLHPTLHEVRSEPT